MGEPPRLREIQLPWEKSIIYFVTLCVKDRRRVLANTRVFEAMQTTISQLRRWRVLAGVIMPEHAYWIVAPIEHRGLSVGDFSTGFKRVLRKTLATVGMAARMFRSTSSIGREPAQQMDLRDGQSCAAGIGPESARLAVLFRFHKRWEGQASVGEAVSFPLGKLALGKPTAFPTGFVAMGTHYETRLRA